MKPVLEDAADFVVVGSGAGGATAARVLSRAGHSVIVLEEGPSLDASQRSLLFLDVLQRPALSANVSPAVNRKPATHSSAITAQPPSTAITSTRSFSATWSSPARSLLGVMTISTCSG